MSDNTRWHQLRAVFDVELNERIPALNQLFVRLEHARSDPAVRDEVLSALFREVHTLKGAARAVEMPRIERLTHALESALQHARGLDRAPSDEWFTLAFRAMDALASVDESPDDVSALMSALVVPEAPLPAAPPGPGPVNLTASAQAEGVRVAVDKLDALLAQAGELAVTGIRIERRQNELDDLHRELALGRREKWGPRAVRAALRSIATQHAAGNHALGPELDALIRTLEQAEERAHNAAQGAERIAADLRRDRAELKTVTRAIEGEVMAIRLVPVERLFGSFHRMVRDLAHATDKEVRLVVEGSQTEIDRKVLEQLRDPVMHMLRNAVDHGIEPPDVRAELGKPREGTVLLSASQRGGAVEVKLADDGAGLDPALLRAAAVRKGMLAAEQAAILSDADACALIFQHAFSTARTVSEMSGRGVGMDVVREHVERLGGDVTVGGSKGAGATFTISVPLSLATTRAILVEQHGQVFAIPSVMVERSARLRVAETGSIQGLRAVVIEGHPLPLVELADALGLTASRLDGVADQWRSYFVLRQAGVRLGVLVDRLVGEQELLVKSLGWPLHHLRNVEGGAVVSTGQTVIILNPSDLLKSAWRRAHASGPAEQRSLMVGSAARRHACLLIVDDSLTTRTLERTIFEAAGYEVLVASDGVEALSHLHKESIDAVVSDVEMPHMDGFALTAAIRRDERTRHLPVVLVTSLEAREHRERGVAVGADAYIVKSRFDQTQLLETVRRLIAA